MTVDLGANLTWDESAMKSQEQTAREEARQARGNTRRRHDEGKGRMEVDILELEEKNNMWRGR